MCGVTGSITKKSANLKPAQVKIKHKILRGLMVAMQERGNHSSGIAGIWKDKTKIIKQAIPADELIDLDKTRRLLNKNPQIVLGHTRWATVGGVSQRNAHPFQYGNIIGCHNGHVSNYRDIFDTHQVEAEVDSEAIFYLLDKHDNDYKHAFSKLNGNFAITWFDKTKPNKVFIARDGNPLFIMYVPELLTYFWASTEESLRAVVAPFYNVSNKEIFEPKEAHTYTISTSFEIKVTPIEFKSYFNTTLRNIEDIKEDDKLADIKLIEATKEIVPNTYYDKTGYPNPFDKTAKRTDFTAMSNHYKLMSLDIKQMENIIETIADGCMMCSQPLNFEKQHGFFWHIRDSFLLCLDCQIAMQEDWLSLIWINLEALDGIYDEVDGYKLEKRDADFSSYE